MVLHDSVTPVPNLVTTQRNGVTEYHNPSTRFRITNIRMLLYLYTDLFFYFVINMNIIMSAFWNLIKVLSMSQEDNFNNRRAGAPKSKILMDLRNLEETEREVLTFCRNEKTRSRVLQFVSDMRESLIETANIAIQTDDSPEGEGVWTEEKFVQTEEKDVQTEDNLVQEILDQFSKLEKDEDILYVFQNLFHILTHQMKALNIIQAFQTLDLNEETMFYHFLMNEKSRIEHLLELVQYQESEVQNTFYETLGGFLNKPLYHASEDSRRIGDRSIEDLMTVNRFDSFEACDIRLKVFFGGSSFQNKIQVKRGIKYSED